MAQEKPEEEAPPPPRDSKTMRKRYRHLENTHGRALGTGGVC